jgi:hypothetical protein
MVLLDSVGKYSRIGDAQRIRDWLVARAATEAKPSIPVLAADIAPQL